MGSGQGSQGVTGYATAEKPFALLALVGEKGRQREPHRASCCLVPPELLQLRTRTQASSDTMGHTGQPSANFFFLSGNGPVARTSNW